MATRDYKNSSRNRSEAAPTRQRKAGGGGGLGAGILIGVILGVMVAVATAFYLNRASNPFTDRAAQNARRDSAPQKEIVPPSGGPLILQPGTQPSNAPAVSNIPPVTDNTVPAVPSSAGGQAAENKVDSYDFYTILPSNGDKVPRPTAPANKHEPTPAAAKSVYFQLGAFSSENEADNLKARLALSGIEATIQSVNVPDKGLVHRVRVGPYTKQEEIDKVRAQLKMEGFNPSLIKAN